MRDRNAHWRVRVSLVHVGRIDPEEDESGVTEYLAESYDLPGFKLQHEAKAVFINVLRRIGVAPPGRSGAVPSANTLVLEATANARSVKELRRQLERDLDNKKTPPPVMGVVSARKA